MCTHSFNNLSHYNFQHVFYNLLTGQIVRQSLPAGNMVQNLGFSNVAAPGNVVNIGGNMVQIANMQNVAQMKQANVVQAMPMSPQVNIKLPPLTKRK